MNEMPGYVSIVFILTTFTAVAFLLQAVKAAGLQTVPAKLLLFLMPLWIIFQSILAVGGFYQRTEALPPRMMVFGVLPAIVLIAAYFLFFRANFIDRLPLRLLTLVHVVRIPVEIVLYWLFIGKLVPQIMTFAGWNYDILSGIFAVIVYLIAFRAGAINKPLIIAFNLVGIGLLFNIVSIAVLSIPSPMQQLAFDQPNQAVLLFPYVFLPTLVVPIVLFSHLAALYKTLRGKTN